MKRRRSKNRVAVARVFMHAPDAKHWAYRIGTAAGLTPAQVSVVLKSMREDGWVTAEWEQPDGVVARSPRRYYALTDLGRRHLPELARGLG